MRSELVALLLAALVATALADIAPSSFLTSPSTLKSGVSGSLSFTLTNTGDATITDVDIFPSGYAFQFLSDKVSVGAIGPGGSTTITVPFRVREGIPAGTYEMQFNAYWVGPQGSRFKSFSVPITVTSEATFQLSQIAFSVEQIHPGDVFEVSAVLANTGGKARNVKLSTSSTDFRFSGSSQVLLGDIDRGASAQVRISMVAGSALAPGTYAIPLTVSYEDELGAQQSTMLTISPVSVYRRQIYFDVVVKPSTEQVLPGQRFVLHVNLTNAGGEQARYVRVSVATNSTSFVLLDSAERYIDALDPGEGAQLDFELGVNRATAPGFYPVQTTVYFSDSKGAEQAPQRQSSGIEVAGTADLDVIASTNPAPATSGKRYSLSLQVSNAGTSQLRSVRVTVASQAFELLGSPDSYIGTLNVGDHSNVSYPVLTRQELAPGRYAVNVTLSFRDADNNERTLVKTAYIDIVLPEVEQRALGTQGNVSPFIWAAVLVILLIAAYVLYRRFVAKRRPHL
mgnify:CR=1 FL=1